ncbi:MAG: hypothetical protein K6T92_04095 [Candidatus Rokubacteria bacterium]|jgi:hypothetical protein|nr:hypothetical protein [Candidatus Rokubacteria bacterium]HXG04826.1 hypothetical protein [Candidatus Binatia bacterium]
MPKAIARTIAVVLLLAGCATTSSRVLRSEFEDIPVPKGLAYVEERSTIIESPTVKAARLLYRGRIEITSLAAALRTTLEANGWRSVSNTTSGPHGTTQVYEKGGNSLQVRLWEGWYYTYVELTASRALQAAR